MIMFQILLALLVLRKLKKEKSTRRYRRHRAGGKVKHSPHKSASGVNHGSSSMELHDNYDGMMNEEFKSNGDIELGAMKNNRLDVELALQDSDDDGGDAVTAKDDEGIDEVEGEDEGVEGEGGEVGRSLGGSDKASSAGTVDGTTEAELRKVLEV